MEPIARRWIEKDGMSDRVQAVSGDFLKDPLPKADVISMGLILHDWNLEHKKRLVRLAYEALPAGRRTRARHLRRRAQAASTSGT